MRRRHVITDAFCVYSVLNVIRFKNLCTGVKTLKK